MICVYPLALATNTAPITLIFSIQFTANPLGSTPGREIIHQQFLIFNS